MLMLPNLSQHLASEQLPQMIPATHTLLGEFSSVLMGEPKYQVPKTTEKCPY